MSQTDKVLQHLKRKSITTYEAFDRYDITRLSGRIYDIRKMGYQVLAKPVLRNGKRFVKYSLAA